MTHFPWNQKPQSHITIPYLVKSRAAFAVLRLLHRDLDPLHVRRVPHRRVEPVAVRVPEGEDRLHRRLALFWVVLFVVVLCVWRC